MNDEARPQGANWLTPYLTVGDVDASLAFYEAAFGFEREMTMPGPGGVTVHGSMLYQGSTIAMMGPQGAWGGTAQTPRNAGVECGAGFYVYCADVDAQVERARKAGAALAREPEDMFWGDRTATVTDPDGYSWTFATRVGEFDPSKVPPM